MTVMSLLTRTLVISGALLTTALLPAATLATEDFSYANGSLYNLSGGTGFASAWSGTSTDWKVVDGSASISSAGTSGSSRKLSTSLTATTTPTFYFSFTLSVDAYGAGTGYFNDYLAFVNASDSAVFSVGGSKPASFDYRLQTELKGVTGAQRLISNNIANPEGSTFSIVGKFTFNDGTGNSVLSVWVNPTGTEDATAAALVYSWAVTETEITHIKLVRWAGGTANATESFDNIRIGSDWSSVTGPIPEPSTYAVIFGAFVMTTVVLRKCRR